MGSAAQVLAGMLSEWKGRGAVGLEWKLQLRGGKEPEARRLVVQRCLESGSVQQQQSVHGSMWRCDGKCLEKE